MLHAYFSLGLLGSRLPVPLCNLDIVLEFCISMLSGESNSYFNANAIIVQDSANCNGGKWIIRFKKVVSGRFWEDLVSDSRNEIVIDQYAFVIQLYDI